MTEQRNNTRENQKSELINKTIAVIIVVSIILTATGFGGVAAGLIWGGEMAIFAGLGLGLLGSSNVISNGLGDFVNDSITYLRDDSNTEVVEESSGLNSQSRATQNHINEVVLEFNEDVHLAEISGFDLEEAETAPVNSGVHEEAENEVVYSPELPQRNHEVEVEIEINSDEVSNTEVNSKSHLFGRGSSSMWRSLSNSPSYLRRRAVGNEESVEIEQGEIKNTADQVPKIK